MRKIIYGADLYERIWAVPITQFCLEFGLSDSGLRKVCKAPVVPTPPAGYWMKLRTGKPVERTPLPPAGARESYMLEAPKNASLPECMRGPIAADLVDRIAAETESSSRIVMPSAGRWILS